MKIKKNISFLLQQRLCEDIEYEFPYFIREKFDKSLWKDHDPKFEGGKFGGVLLKVRIVIQEKFTFLFQNPKNSYFFSLQYRTSF